MFLVNTNHFRWAWATGISVLAVLSVQADNHQPVADSLVMNSSVVDRDYQETELRFYASPSQNASFLTEMEGGNLSYLECSGQLRRGKLVDYYQSDRSRIFDVQTGSYYRFSDRLMLAGSLSYGSDKGKHQSGSVFIHPEQAPFDIVEMDPQHAGTKRREWYSLSGRAGYAIHEKVSLGAALDYTIENYAKFKDLRHQNSLMDLHVSVGGTYRIVPQITLGAAYVYRRNIERVSFKIYGNTDQQYTSLISFGGFYGRSELFGESGYTSHALPLFTQTHGGTVQLAAEKGGMKWFNEWGFYQEDGRFGTGASTAIIYSHHRGSRLEYRSKLVRSSGRLLHVIGLNAYRRSLENEENSYKESTDANGVSQIVYYGSNRVGEKVWKGANVSYTLLSGSTPRKRADWMAGMEAGYEARLLTASPYPFYRKQDIRTVHGTAFFTRNWLGRKQGYSLSVEAGYAAGWGHRNQDGTYASVSEHQKAPVSLEHYLNQEYDYRVSRQVKSGVSGGYERALSSRLSLYAKVEVTYAVALNTRLKGESQTVCGLSAGVKF